MAFSAVVQLVAMAFCASTKLILPEQIAVWSWFSTGSLGLLTPVAFVAIGFDPELEAMLGKVAVDVDALKTRDRG